MLFPNVLSVLRILLAPAMLYVDSSWRAPFLMIAIASDFFDGFLARRWAVTSKFGTIVDPIGDKILAGTLGYLYWSESLLTYGDLVAIFLRDIVIVVFTAFLLVSGKWAAWKIQSFLCGKIATFLQGILFLFMMCGHVVPTAVIVSLIVVGIMAPFELIFLSRKQAVS